jgi:predicted nucleic acid-binding protein
MASVAQKKLRLPQAQQARIQQTQIQQGQIQQDLSDLARQGLRQFEEADIMFHQVSPTGVLELAARYQLTAYDATYLWLAAELKCPLLTFDVGLGKAATTHLALLP